MSVTSTNSSGTLSGGGPDLIRTSTGTEFVAVYFRNYSGGPVVLTIYDDDTDPEDVVFDDTLATKESVDMRGRLGSGKNIYAESDTVNAISWHLERDDLS